MNNGRSRQGVWSLRFFGFLLSESLAGYEQRYGGCRGIAREDRLAGGALWGSKIKAFLFKVGGFGYEEKRFPMCKHQEKGSF